MMISKEYTIEFAHRIENDLGRERYLHGHSGKIVVKFTGKINKHGKICVYGFERLEKAIDELDHSLIVDENDKMLEVLLANEIEVRVVKFSYPPTAENMVKYLIEKVIQEQMKALQLFEVSFTEVSGCTITQNKDVVRCQDEM